MVRFPFRGVPMRKCRSDGNDNCADLGDSCNSTPTRKAQRYS